MSYAVPIDIAEANHGAFIYGRGGQFDHRGMVLRSVCDLEFECAQMLFAYFSRRNPGITWEIAEGELFGENSLLGSLTKMVRICTYLALLDDDEAHDLRLLARLRNMYAHGRDRTQFYEDPKSRAILRSLQLYKNSLATLQAHDDQDIFRACSEYLRHLLQQKAEFLRNQQGSA